jgi:hypothetical protein
MKLITKEPPNKKLFFTVAVPRLCPDATIS